MKIRFLLLSLLLLPGLAPAQPLDSVRQNFIAAFRDDDRVSAAMWLDSLDRLENDQQLALLHDERWLAFYWLGWYGNIFDEAASFDVEENAWRAGKSPPPSDSLFRIVDRALFNNRFELYKEIGSAFLTEEEKAFSVLMLDYLLRTESTDEAWAKRADAFFQRYPGSRFTTYLHSVRPEVLVPGRSAACFSVLLFNGTWRGAIEGTLRPAWGGQFGVAWWRRRLNLGLQFAVSSQKLEADVPEDGFTWPRGDPSNLLLLEAEAGYDIIDARRLRLFPSVAGGFTYLTPPTPDETEDPNPDYYDNFRFFTGHFTVALNADIRFPVDLTGAEGFGPGSSQGIRLTAGYRRLFFGRNNPLLAGDMVFVGLGYQLFMRGKGK